MTVCVAAFAQDEEAIVMISDKAVTLSGREIDMQSDTAICKTVRLGDSSWYAMLSGSVSFAEEVARNVTARITANPTDAQDTISISRCVTAAYTETWKQHLVAQVFTPKLLTEDMFFQRSRRLLPLPDSYINPITEDLNKFWIDCDLLVCGFDIRKKPHIIQITAPGRAHTHDTMGYWAVGAGADMAVGRLMWKETARTYPLDRVLYEALDAKAHAELIQGVGYGWDAHILVKGRGSADVVPENIRDLVDDAFNFGNNNWPPYDKLDEDDLPEGDWQKQVKEYAELIMNPERGRKRFRRKRIKKLKSPPKK